MAREARDIFTLGMRWQYQAFLVKLLKNPECRTRAPPTATTTATVTYARDRSPSPSSLFQSANDSVKYKDSQLRRVCLGFDWVLNEGGGGETKLFEERD